MATDPFDQVNAERVSTPQTAPTVVNDNDPFARVNAEKQAKYGLAGVSGVAPAAAAQALAAQPKVGVPAATGMYNPADTQAQFRQAQQAQALQNPAVAAWASQADPAHVAAAQDDLPALDKVSQLTQNWQNLGWSTDDFAHAFGPAWKQLQVDAERYYKAASTPTIGGFKDLGPLGSMLKDAAGVAGSVFAPVVDPLARVYASIPLPMYKTGFLKAPQVAQTNEQRFNLARGDVGLALSGLGGDVGVVARSEFKAAGGEGAASKPEAAPPGSPPHQNTDGTWHTTPEGFIADVNGAPISFNSPKEAGIWYQKHGYATGTDQIFDLDTGAKPGQVYVKEVGRSTPATDGVPPVGVHPGVDAVRAQFAEMDAGSIADIQHEIAQAAVTTSSPTTMEDFLNYSLPGRMVAVDPDKLVELAQQGHEPFPDHAQEIAEAAQSGGLFEVPLAKYLAATSGQPFAEELNAASVFREGGISAEQAKEGIEPSTPPTTSAELDTTGLKPEEVQRAKTIAAANTQAVQQVFAQQYLAPLFSEAKALDLTEPQLTRLSNAVQEAVETAHERALQRAYDQVKRERKPDFVEAAKGHAERIAGEIEQLPVVRAYRQLSSKGYKLDKDLTANFFPEPASRLPSSVMKANGNHPDLAADALGYDSGAKLVSDLADLHSAIQASGANNLNGYIKLQSTNAGRDAAASELGFDLTPESLAEAAHEMVPQEAIERLLSDELRTYAGKAKLPFDKAKVKAAANELFQRLPAKKAVGFKKLEDDVGRNGRKAFAAAQKGNWPLAFKYKQNQYVRRLMLRQAFDFQKTYNRTLKDFKRFAGAETMKSMDQTYLNLIHSVLREHGYDVPLTQLQYNYNQWAEQARAAGEQVLPFEPVQLGDPKDLSVEQFTDLANRVENLAHLGREVQTATVQGKKEELNNLVFEAVQGAAKVPRRPVNTKAIQPARNEMSVASLSGMMNSPEVMFDILDDHNPNGVWNRLLMRGSREAAGADNTVLRPEIEAVGQAVQALKRADWDRWGKRIPTGHGLMDPASPRNEMALVHQDLIGIALNAGSEHGRWHLEEGGNGWNRDDWTRVLGDNMTPEDWGFVQSIARSLESAWPKIAEGERALYGVVPEKAETDGYTLPDGTAVDGHYFPLKRDDARASRLTGPPKITEQELFDHFVREASTPAGHTKRRTWAAYPVSLDWQATLNQHLPNVSKRLSYTQFVQDANKFLRQPEIAQLLHDVHGPFAQRELESWLHRQVGYSSTDPRLPAVHQMIARELRLRTYAVMTGLKLSIGLEHLTSVAQTAAVAGVRAPIAAYTRALLATLANPGSVGRFVEESSPYMMARHNSTSRELRDTLDDINNHKKLLGVDLGPVDQALDLARIPGDLVNKLSANFFNWINHTLVARPTWFGVYWDARGGQAHLRGHSGALPAMDHADAVAYADKVIGKSHGSGLELDMGSFQSGGKNELLKLTNMFNVFRGTIGHIAREGVYIAKSAKTPQEFLDGLLMVLIGAAGVVTVGKLVTDQGPKKADPVSLTMWMMDNLLDGLSHTLPYGDQLYKVGENYVSAKPIDFEVSPAEGTVKYAAKGGTVLANAARGAVGDRKAARAATKDKRWIEDVATFLGFLLKAPLGQPGETAQVMYDMNHGRVKHPAAALAFGPSHEKDKGRK